jgi:hypothetical protein
MTRAGSERLPTTKIVCAEHRYEEDLQAWDSIGRVSAAPIAIGFQIATEITGPQTDTLLTNHSAFDFSSNTVPVTVHPSQKRAPGRTGRQ